MRRSGGSPHPVASRWIAFSALAAFFAIEPAAAQRRLPWTAPAPALSLGQRVRVWTWEPGFPVFGRSPFAGPRDVRLVGTLLAYSPLDSVRIARTGPAALFSPNPERTVYWSSVAQIDVPNGRNTLGGAAGGLAGAFGVALFWAVLAKGFGCEVGNSCPNVWRSTARISLLTVPAGAVYGFFSTRWKRVY